MESGKSADRQFRLEPEHPDRAAERDLAGLPPLVTVNQVCTRYGLRDRAAARRVMRAAGAFVVAGRLVIRTDDLDAFERAEAAAARRLAVPARSARSRFPRRNVSAPSSHEPLRTGWWRERERIEPGVYRLHTVRSPASKDQRPGRRCGCAFQVLVPGMRPGITRAVTVRGSVSQARAERRRLQAAGRPVAVAAVPDPSPTLSVNALAEQWIHTRSGVLAPNTLAVVEVDLRLRIAPVLGDTSANEVTRQRVEELVADLIRQGASVRMVRGAVSTLRRLLQAAVDWGLIANNPARRVRLPAPETHTRQAHERVLSMAELSVLVSSCRGSLRTETMVRAMAEAGLRRGEVIGLRWEDVDLAGRRVHVRRSVSDVHGLRRERTTKGKRSRRVAISEGLVERLDKWRTRSGDERATGYVWPGTAGQPMNAHSPNQSLARVLRRAGLTDSDGVPLVTPHGLRHTAASLMLAAGVPLIVVSRQLGHANPNVAAQVYAHLLADSQLDEAAAAFAGLGSSYALRG
jgi:integrase